MHRRLITAEFLGDMTYYLSDGNMNYARDADVIPIRGSLLDSPVLKDWISHNKEELKENPDKPNMNIIHVGKPLRDIRDMLNHEYDAVDFTDMARIMGASIYLGIESETKRLLDIIIPWIKTEDLAERQRRLRIIAAFVEGTTPEEFNTKYTN
jgi:hypothetical protein